MAEAEEKSNSPVLERQNSFDSDLSYISATHSLNDDFEKEQYEEIVNSIQKLLAKQIPKWSLKPTRNATALIKLLENCFEEQKMDIKLSNEVIANKNNEIEDLKGSFDEKMNLIIEENNNRFDKLIKDQENQLSAAIERAVNARRQTASLQTQLSLATTKLANQEQTYREDNLMAFNEHRDYIEKFISEREKLSAMTIKLEEKSNQYEKQISQLTEGKNAIQEELEIKNKLHQSLMNEFDKSGATFQTKIEFAESELKRERVQNHRLWSKTNNQSQQIAILKARLEFANKEISHRTKMFSLLKNETFEKINDHNQASNSFLSVQNSSSLLGANNLNFQRRDEELKNKLEESLETEEILSKDLSKIMISIKTKSDEIRTNSERLKHLNDNVKLLDDQIAKTFSDSHSKEIELKNLREKMQRREKQFQILSKRASREISKVYELDSTLKLSQERERTMSEKLKALEKEEDRLNNDCILTRVKMESMLNVLQSRRNIIKQLETESKKTEEHINKLMSETLSSDDSQFLKSTTTPSIAGATGRRQRFYSTSIDEGGEKSMSLVSNEVISEKSFENRNDEYDTINDEISMSLVSDVDSIPISTSSKMMAEKENISPFCLVTIPTNPTKEPNKAEQRIGYDFNSDTDSGVSIKTGSQLSKKPDEKDKENPFPPETDKYLTLFQSTPVKQSFTAQRESKNFFPLNSDSVVSIQTGSQSTKTPDVKEHPFLPETDNYQFQNTPATQSINAQRGSDRKNPSKSARKLNFSSLKSSSAAHTRRPFSEMVEIEKHDSATLSSPGPSVSINIFQATGRVRHNSLPSSAKNRVRYRTRVQDHYPIPLECPPDCQPIFSAETNEQSSQTASSSFIANYCQTFAMEMETTNSDQELTTDDERLSADGTLEPAK